jgi:hypothetical protein
VRYRWGGKSFGSLIVWPFLLSGCVNTTAARFVQTEQSFELEPRRASTHFIWNVADLASPPMSSVGFVEVTGHCKATLLEFMDKAVEEGKRVGCDVLLPHAVYEVYKEPGGPKQWQDLATWGEDATRMVGSGVCRWQFVCAVKDSSDDPAVTRKRTMEAALAIQLNESGLAMCRFEPPIGSHIVRQVCRYERGGESAREWILNNIGMK